VADVKLEAYPKSDTVFALLGERKKNEGEKREGGGPPAAPTLISLRFLNPPSFRARRLLLPALRRPVRAGAGGPTALHAAGEWWWKGEREGREGAALAGAALEEREGAHVPTTLSLFLSSSIPPSIPLHIFH